MNLLRTLRTFGMQEWRSSSNLLKTAGQIRMCSAEAAGESEEAETVDPAKDRRIPTPLEVGLRYMESKAYQTTYGDLPVYTEYRRNHKGQLPPKKTRKSCTRKQIISTGNPCPICRDEYLVLEPENVKLLNQFISDHTGQILSYSITGLCQRKHNALVVAIIRAKEQGRIIYDVPFREYNYDEYISKISINE